MYQAYAYRGHPDADVTFAYRLSIHRHHARNLFRIPSIDLLCRALTMSR